MKFELNDDQADLLRETVEAAVDDLNERIASENHPERRVLRDRRVRLRLLCEALPAR